MEERLKMKTVTTVTIPILDRIVSIPFKCPKCRDSWLHPAGVEWLGHHIGSVPVKGPKVYDAEDSVVRVFFRCEMCHAWPGEKDDEETTYCVELRNHEGMSTIEWVGQFVVKEKKMLPLGLSVDQAKKLHRILSEQLDAIATKE